MTAAQGAVGVVEVDAAGRPIRDINRDIRTALETGDRVTVRNPGARHNLGVALLQPGKVSFDGSVGYYCGGMGDGATIHVAGSAGWGLAEGMLSGTVVVDGNAGSSAAASIRGGTVVVRGDCAARAGVAMKGGALLIGGDVGYMAAFMMQKGIVAIAGSAGDALADSMYEGVVFVGGGSRRSATTRSSRMPPTRTSGWSRACTRPMAFLVRRASGGSCRAARCGRSRSTSWKRGGRHCDRRPPGKANQPRLHAVGDR